VVNGPDRPEMRQYDLCRAIGEVMGRRQEMSKLRIEQGRHQLPERVYFSFKINM
jgi:hypothetical protein